MGGSSGCLWWAGLTGTNVAAGVTQTNDMDANFAMYGTTFNGNWTSRHKQAVASAIQLVGNKLAGIRNDYETAAGAFNAVYRGVNFTWGDSGAGIGCLGTTGGGCTTTRHQINFWSMSGDIDNSQSIMVKNVVHELGHAYDWTFYDPASKTRASSSMPGSIVNSWDLFLRTNEPVPNYYDWQQHPSSMANGNTPGETFADMFIAWTYDVWNVDNAKDVAKAQEWVKPWMP
jgi:hypothetical protein